MLRYSYKSGLFSFKTMWEETKNLTQDAAVTVRYVSIPEDQISNGSFHHKCKAKDLDNGNRHAYCCCKKKHSMKIRGTILIM